MLKQFSEKEKAERGMLIYALLESLHPKFNRVHLSIITKVGSVDLLELPAIIKTYVRSIPGYDRLVLNASITAATISDMSGTHLHMACHFNGVRESVMIPYGIIASLVVFSNTNDDQVVFNQEYRIFEPSAPTKRPTLSIVK